MHGPYGESANGLTIGQLAEYAGVTIKAVRHDHRPNLHAIRLAIGVTPLRTPSLW